MFTFRKTNKEIFGKKRNLLVFVFILSLFVLTTPLKSTAIYDLSSDNPNPEYEVSYNSIRDPLGDSYFSINAGPFPDNKPLRVAIYDEGDTASPTYTTHQGAIHNNFTGMADILSMTDHITAVPLTTAQIDDHQLTTANYDVLILIDNHPNILLDNIVGHSDIAGDEAVNLGIRYEHNKKIDPGPKWDWEKFHLMLSEKIDKSIVDNEPEPKNDDENNKHIYSPDLQMEQGKDPAPESIILRILNYIIEIFTK